MGFTSETLWGLNPWERIFSGWVFHASLGGLTGLIEPCVLTAMALWVAIGIFQNRYVLRDQFDINLLLCATLFILAALVLPVKFSNTLAFCDRWLPVGLSLLLLACPAPTLPKGMDKILALAVLATFCVATSTAWLDFERHEFSGITEAIADLPPGQRVIGVDLIQTSDKIKVWQPFIQTFAYAQVVKGGSLNFSFADFPNSLVYYSPPRRITWTRGLEWDGAKTTPYDLLQFDYALVGVRPDSAKEYQSLLSDLSPISKM
jgi:hypothetical protein